MYFESRITGTLIEAENGGRLSLAITSFARMNPAAPCSATVSIFVWTVSFRTTLWASGIEIILYRAAGVAGPSIVISTNGPSRHLRLRFRMFIRFPPNPLDYRSSTWVMWVQSDDQILYAICSRRKKKMEKGSAYRISELLCLLSFLVLTICQQMFNCSWSS